MSVQRDLELIRMLLVTLTAARDCVNVTGFDAVAVRGWVETLDRVIKRYKGEARRVRKYYRR